MTPQLKLTYFNMPGRAEVTRLALNYGQIPFEDERVQKHDFAAIKPTLPLGQVPVLTVDGKVYSQSHAIARYCAKLAGLYPEDPLQALRVDMIIDTVTDSWMDLAEVRFMQLDAKTQMEKSRKFLDETAPKIFTALEKMVQGETFMGTMSLADLSLFDHIENGIKYCFPDFKLEAYPKVNKVYHSVKTQPNIAAYLAKQQLTN